MRLPEINVTLVIVLITIIVSIYAFGNEKLKRKWVMNPYIMYRRKEYWRFLTSAFIHSNWMHLGFNMFALWLFGSALEDNVFAVYYVGNLPLKILVILGLYIPAAVLSSFYTFEKQKNNIHYSDLGASGAVAAVVFAFIAIYPTARFYFFIPAFIYGLLYLLFSWSMVKRGQDGISHDAHFFGALYGLMYIFIIQPHRLKDFFLAITFFFENIFK